MELPKTLRFISFISLFIFNFRSIIAQPEIAWTHTYGGNNWDEGHCVRETADGGYIVGGLTMSFSSGLYDVYLIRTTENGDLLWSQSYGGAGWDEARAVQQTSDGGFITSGRTTSFGAGDSDIYVIKTDADGDTLWTGTYGGVDYDDSQWIGEIPGEGYIITGETFSYGEGGGDILLLKIDLDGDLVWYETYGGPSDEDAQWAQFTSDGGIIITGSTDSFGLGSDDVFLVKTNSQGEMQWSNTFGGGEPDLSLSVVESSLGGYIIAGQTESYGNGNDDVYLIGVDENGNLLWEKTFGHSQADAASSIVETSDGGLAFAGVLTTDEGGFDAWIVKTDAQGDSLWTQVYSAGPGWETWDIAFSIQSTNDGGFIVTGMTGVIQQFNVFLMKIESESDPQSSVFHVPDDFPDIQSAISYATDGDTVLVHPGVYLENINFSGKNIVVGSLFITTGDTSYISQTVIDGNQSGSVVLFENNEDLSSELRGFSIVNGTGTFLLAPRYGGGIFCHEADPTLKDLIIYDNHTGTIGVGGGLALYLSNSLVENVVIYGNSAAGGGGIFGLNNNGNIRNVSLEDNWTYGAFDAGGGGMLFQDSAPVMDKVLIHNNSSSVGGGAIALTGCDAVMNHITIGNNLSGDETGSIYLFHTNVSLINSILWNDQLDDEIYFHNYENWGTITVSYSDIQGGIDAIETSDMGNVVWGEGNFGLDPIFAGVESGDYNLQPGSPCIDSGDPDSPFDPDSTVTDLGAFYFHQNTGPQLVEIFYVEDWNLVGLPLDVADASYSTVFPDAIGETFFSFSDGYTLTEYLVPGVGYWLRFPDEGSAFVEGTIFGETSFAVSEGWNLMSGISGTSNTTDIFDPDGILIENTFYGFNGSYFQTDYLVPGLGLWVRANSDGIVFLSGTRQSTKVYSDISVDNPVGNELVFSNSKGYQTTLLLGGSEVDMDPLRYDLPPVPPAGAFDVRFSGDLKYSYIGGEIQIQNDHYPLTINCVGTRTIEEETEWVLVNTESGNEFIMCEVPVVIHGSVSELLLTKRAAIPSDFILHQNIPNPFNPTTTLHYQLPNNIFVNISIYNMLGKQIKVLVNDNNVSGTRSVQWDGTDSKGQPVSAGAYLYQIQAGEFVQTRKMVLLK